MAKSRGRKFAEITSPTSGVFDLTSVPTITNAKLQNSAMTLAGSSVSLGGTGVADTDALSEGSSNLYFTNARVQSFLGGGTLAGNIVVPDNISIYLGSSSDFRLVHNTINTQLINATGALQITSNGGFAVTGAATFSSTITATGNITGTLATAAQPNITSVGTLTGLTMSGALTLNTGSSGVPTINLSHSNSGADNFRIMAGITGVSNSGFSIYDVDASASRLVINSSGHVGIGLATAPSAPLDVITNSTVWVGEFTQNNTSNGDGVIITVGSTAQADYALSVRPNAGNTPALNVKADGTVGIGTFSPSHSLHVLSTDNKGFLLDRNTGNEPANLNEFSSYYSLSIKNRATGTYLNFGGGTAGTKIQATDGAGSAAAKFIALNPYGGNVGIGTGNTTPDASLHIKSNTPIIAFAESDASQDYRIGSYGGTFAIRDETDSAYRFVVNGSGNVGINETNPTGRLHIVEGNNYAKFGDFHSNSTMALQMADSTAFPVEIQAYSSQLRFNTATSSNATPSTKMMIDSGGTVGIGTTDLHSWATFDGRLRVGARAFFGTTTGSSQMGYNWYYDGAYKYIAGDYANRYIQNDGHHWWQTATSGSADGTISWVSKMRLDRDGKLTLGPDYNDIQIAPASTNSGVNSIYLRGNASGEKSQIILNHYGYADYYIGTGLVGNGIFTIGTNNNNANIAVDNSGVVYIHPNNINQSADERLKIGGAVFRDALGGNDATAVYETCFSAQFTANQQRYIRINIDGNVFGSIQITLTGNYSNVNAIGSFSRVYGVGYNSSNTSNYANDAGGYTVWDRGTTSGKFSFGNQYKPNATTGYIPIASTEGTYTIDGHFTIRMEGSLAGVTSVDIV